MISTSGLTLVPSFDAQGHLQHGKFLGKGDGGERALGEGGDRSSCYSILQAVSISQCYNNDDQNPDTFLIHLQLGGRAKAITGGNTTAKRGLPKAPLNAIRPSPDDSSFIEVSTAQTSSI